MWEVLHLALEWLQKISNTFVGSGKMQDNGKKTVCVKKTISVSQHGKQEGSEGRISNCSEGMKMLLKTRGSCWLMVSCVWLTPHLLQPWDKWLHNICCVYTAGWWLFSHDRSKMSEAHWQTECKRSDCVQQSSNLLAWFEVLELFYNILMAPCISNWDTYNNRKAKCPRVFTETLRPQVCSCSNSHWHNLSC